MQDIHDGCLGYRDQFAVIRFECLTKRKDRIVQHVRLYQDRHILARLFVAVDGNHLHTRFVPESTTFVREDLEELAAFAALYLAVTEDEGLDFVHQTVFCVRKINGAFY